MKNYIFIIFGVVYFAGFFYLKLFQEDIYENLNSYLYFSYVVSILNGLVGILLSLSVINIIQKIINKAKEKKSNEYLTTFFVLIKKFINITKYLISIYIGIKIIQIPTNFQAIVDKVFSVAFMLTVLLLATTLITTFFDEIENKFTNNGLTKQVFPLLRKSIVVIIWIIGLITIISNLGYDVNALIAGAGISGLALALASQKTVANIFGAVSILINKPFKVGDKIKIGGSTGTVKDLGLIYLKITDTNGHEIMIPNETIISTTIENFSVREAIKVDFSFSIDYKLSREKIKKSFELIENILKNLEKEKIIKKYDLSFETFSTSGIKIIGNLNIDNKDSNKTNKIKEDFNIEVKETFEKEGISLI